MPDPEYWTHPTFIGFFSATGLYFVVGTLYGTWCFIKKLTN